MDWSALARTVAPVAPKLGAVLGAGVGGPFGGFIGGIAGRAIAGALGVNPDPQAVANAIAGDSEAVRKLQILEATEGERIRAQAQTEVERLKAQAAQAESIGQTQRAELNASVPWWHWRHLLGYVTMLFGLVLVAGFAKAMFIGGDLADFTALVAQAAVIFGILATLNGYVASDTSRLKATEMTGILPSSGIASLVNAVTGKR